MIEFLEGILDFLKTLVDFIVSVFQNLLYVIKSVPRALVAVSEVLGLLPAFLTVPIFAFLSLCIFFVIINHWGN